MRAEFREKLTFLAGAGQFSLENHEELISEENKLLVIVSFHFIYEKRNISCLW